MAGFSDVCQRNCSYSVTLRIKDRNTATRSQVAQFSKFGCITLLFNLFQLCNKSLFRRDGLIGIRGEFYVINQCALRFGWEKSNQRFARAVAWAGLLEPMEQVASRAFSATYL